MLKLRIVLVLAVLAAALAPAAAQWKPAKAPIMSRWAKDVSAETAHREYPRPQMVRDEWMNLNGLWQYQIVGKDAAAPIGKDLPGTILVPFPVESALSGVGKRAEWLHYRRLVTIPKAWAGKRVLLHFGAVDWDATVYVNGAKVGTHRGGYDAFSFDITEQAKIGQANEIVVTVWDPTSHGPQARGKQVDNPRGIWYTPTTGIWQTVWLEPVAPTHVQSVGITPDIDAETAQFALRLAARQGGLTTATIRILAEGKEVGEATISVGSVPGDARKDRPATLLAPKVLMAVKNPRLWSPDSPFLYDVEVSVYEGDKLVDRVTSYFGMRKISLGKDKDGFTRILLNNKFVFQIGFLDQGFWPDGLYTAPTDAALRYDIEASKKLGMNMARKHVKIEPDRWYYWCDKLGLLVWQDMPSGDTTKDRPQFQKELTALVTGRGNHPSIVMWVVFNEGWGQVRKGRGPAEGGREDTKLHVDLIRKLDPTRLICNASGWTDYAGLGDIIDIHRYPGPGAPEPEPKRAGVLGEFGGLGLPIKGHLWQDKKNWGYRNMKTREELTDRYVKLLRGVHDLKVTKGLSAAVYTQTTDCEGEVNGLMTYDRAIIKPDVAKVAAANRGDFPPPPKVVGVVPTSEVRPQTWRITTDKPKGDWMKADFDDTGWKPAKGGFGRADTPGAKVRTEWRTNDIWLRRTFGLKDTKFTNLSLRMHHDEDAEVYLNGVKACAVTGFTTDYDEFPVSAEAKAALKKGTNVLAVHCKQTRGGQYIDAGLIDLIPREKKP